MKKSHMLRGLLFSLALLNVTPVAKAYGTTMQQAAAVFAFLSVMKLNCTKPEPTPPSEFDIDKLSTAAKKLNIKEVSKQFYALWAEKLVGQKEKEAGVKWEGKNGASLQLIYDEKKRCEATGLLGTSWGYIKPIKDTFQDIGYTAWLGITLYNSNMLEMLKNEMNKNEPKK